MISNRDGVRSVRYDKPIYFVSEGESIRLPNGDWSDPIEVKTKAWANISDTGSERMTLVYGGFNKGSLTIRLQNHYNEPFHHIEVGDLKYLVDMERKLRRDHVFVVSEVV